MIFAVDSNNWFHVLFAGGSGKDATKNFLRRLELLPDQYRATTIIAAFDGDKCWHRELYPEYKAHREAKPKMLVAELNELPEAVRQSGLAVVVRSPMYEADNVLATTADIACTTPDLRCVLATSDKDARQCLVMGRVNILKRINISYGEAAAEWVTAEQHEAATGVMVERWAEYLALTGDAADNIPGVDGIGPKTAANMLEGYSLTELLADPVAAGVPERFIDRLVAFRDNANLWVRLTTLYRAVPGVRELLPQRQTTQDQAVATDEPSYTAGRERPSFASGLLPGSVRYDMSDFINTRSVRGRKQHVCDLCRLRIRSGAKHVIGSGVFDGRPFRVRYHAVCLSKTVGWDQSDWESLAGADDEFRKFDLGLPLLSVFPG